MKHCYEYIQDEHAPVILRRWIKYYAAPSRSGEAPSLYATLDLPSDDQLMKFYHEHHLSNGSRVKLVMCSRLGDVGIARVGSVEYEARVYIEWLRDFSETS